MIIKTLNMGEFRVNNYLVIDEETSQAAIIDAGGDYELTVSEAKKYNAKIKYVLNTHGHLDHIAGDYDLQTKEGARVFVHKDDLSLVNSLKQHLQLFGMPDYEIPKVDEFVEDGQIITLGNLEFKVIHTPGHSQGGVCYLIDDNLFSGDTLFAESVGRTDLPGGSYEQLMKSIKEKLFTLDDSVKVFPGHGAASTIGHEKRYNPFFR